MYDYPLTFNKIYFLSMTYYQIDLSHKFNKDCNFKKI